MKAHIVPVIVGILVFAAGVGLVFTSGSPRICNAQAQGLVFALAAGVAAWYATETARMANATQKTAEATKQMVKLTCAPELVAWLVWYSRNQEPLICVCRVHNLLKGAAVNVRLLPLWDIETNPDKRDVVLEEGEILREFKQSEWPRPNRPARAIVIAGEKFGEMPVTRPPSEADKEVGVLCVRWDDPANTVRRWSCWRHDAVGSRHQRVRISRPENGTGCDYCSERREDDKKCPHELGDKYARCMYGRED